ncbi:MAG: sulfite exporter TauE/SafE family protein [Pirellulaceae bacterium]
MKIPVQWKAIFWSNVGGFVGLFVGFEISVAWPPSFTKMFFVSLWAAFAIALHLINHRGRSVIPRIERYDARKIAWLLGIGVVGGMVTGLTGSGLDILTFAVLTLVFRLCESVGTPTSVIIMAFNAMLGFAIRGIRGELLPDAISYWWCAVPVVVVGAPLGAWYIKNKDRHFITRLLYASVVVQFVGALWIVPQSPATVAIIVCVISGGAAIFFLMNRLGTRLS